MTPVQLASASDFEATTPAEASGFANAVRALRALHEDDLNRVSETISKLIESPVSMIPELGGHLITAGGKRLRPLLTLSTARILDYADDDHIKLAAAVELIHGATLLHDDVVDASNL
ncbi:MAG: polyprenyl synthetase family protein, partial [Pseudomonadota bacterium]